MAGPSPTSPPPASPRTTSDGAPASIGLFVGLATLDCLYRVAAPPGPNQKITALDQEIAAGGPAANAAITFAALGGHATLVTDLGTHPLARAAADDLVANGVVVRAVEPESARVPAVSSIYLTAGSGDRSVVSVNATAGSGPPPDWLGQLVEGADVVLLDGHHPELALAAARAARRRSVPVLLDAGSWKPVFEELLPLVDVAICSADLRVPALVGGDIVEDDPESIAKDLLRRGPEWVAISFGGDPARWWTATGDPDDARSSGSVPIPAVVVRDTLGAGDVLHGGFALHRARGAGNLAALRSAVRYASDRTTHLGPAAWRQALRALTSDALML